MIWTPGQEFLFRDIPRWHKRANEQLYKIIGPAGTGKTTIAKHVIELMGLSIHDVIFVAFTGKASSVLNLKGLPAQTIHSVFYELRKVPYYKDGEVVKRNGRIETRLEFAPVDFIPKNIKLIWLDESGMADEKMAKDMLKHGIPIISTGDPFQLEPIFGFSPFVLDPDAELFEITRQAEGSGIIQLATMIREGKDLRWYMNFNNQAHVMPKSFIQERHLLNADIVLTPKNKTRNVFNRKIRELKGSFGDLPNIGDKMINRKNNWTMACGGVPLVNGTLGTVVNPIRRSKCNLNKGLYSIDFQPDYISNQCGWEYYDSLLCDLEYLKTPCMSNKPINKYNNGNKLEFGECLTVHLSQGSEYDQVLYWVDNIMDEEYMRRMNYTAVTRAKESVYMFV